MYHLLSLEEKFFSAIQVPEATSHNYVSLKTDDSLFYLNTAVVYRIAFGIHDSVV